MCHEYGALFERVRARELRRQQERDQAKISANGTHQPASAVRQPVREEGERKPREPIPV